MCYFTHRCPCRLWYWYWFVPQQQTVLNSVSRNPHEKRKYAKRILYALLFWVYSCQKRISFLTRCYREWLISLYFYTPDGRFSIDQFPVPPLHVPFFLCNGHSSCTGHCGGLSHDLTRTSCLNLGCVLHSGQKIRRTHFYTGGLA